MARVAVAMGEKPGDAAPHEMAHLGLARVKRLMADLDFPTQISADQLDPAGIPQMVDVLLEQGIYCLFRQVTLRVADGKDLAELYERSTQGWS